MLREKIEERTAFCLPYGELNVYETNQPCADYPFFFDKPMVTMMLSGSKQIRCGKETFVFEGRNVLIPQHGQQLSVDISQASAGSPTRCIVLDIAEDFVQGVFTEVMDKWQPEWKQLPLQQEAATQFVSSEATLCSSLKHLYSSRTGNKPSNADYLLTLNMKELVYLLLSTGARNLLYSQDELLVETGSMDRVVNFIRSNYRKAISIKDLCKVACMSEAGLFQKFKASFNCSPVEYIIHLILTVSSTMLPAVRPVLTVNCMHSPVHNTTPVYCNTIFFTAVVLLKRSSRKYMPLG
jgi:hypothetical protein